MGLHCVSSVRKSGRVHLSTASSATAPDQPSIKSAMRTSHASRYRFYVFDNQLRNVLGIIKLSVWKDMTLRVADVPSRPQEVQKWLPPL